MVRYELTGVVSVYLSLMEQKGSESVRAMNPQRESGRKSFQRGYSEGRLIALGDCVPIVANVDDFKLRLTAQGYRVLIRSVDFEFGERRLCHWFLDD